MTPWYRRLLPYAKPELPALAGIAMLSLASVAVDLLRPWPLKLIIDHVLAGRPLPPGVADLALLPGAASPAGLLAWLAGPEATCKVVGSDPKTGKLLKDGAYLTAPMSGGMRLAPPHPGTMPMRTSGSAIFVFGPSSAMR